MNTGFSLKLILEYREIFDDKPLSVSEYLKGISREKMLTVGAHFLGFNNKNSRFNDHKEFLEMYFCHENNKLANNIYTKIKTIEKNKSREILILNALTSLQLFEFCFENLGKENTQTNAELEVNLFKAYLLLNQLNTQRDNIASKTTESLESEYKLAGLSLAQSFAYSDIANYDLVEAFTCQLVKAVYLFDFLKSRNDTAKLCQSFLELFNCKSSDEYLKRIIPLGISIIRNDGEGHLDINVEADEDYKINIEFLDNLVVLDHEPITDIDFRKLRTKPFYKIEKDKYRVIFGLFVIEKIFKGLYFLLRNVNATLSKSDKLKDFRSFYCEYFSERTLLYDVLHETYGGRYIEFSGSQMKESGLEAEPDYYIRRGNYVFLFESKDILINVDVKTSRDYNQIEEAFKEKFYFEVHDGKKANKAVLQLVNNIKRILNRELPFDSTYKQTSIRIYPILVIHDDQYNLSGLNVIINKWFKEEIKNLEDSGVPVDKVHDLTIIDIDTLIFYQDSFKARKIKLDKVIDEYHKYIKFDRNKKYRDKEHVHEHIKRTVVPFSIFLSNYSHSKGFVGVPSILREKGYSLFQ
ncbi:MAG: hypothetical protein RLO81_00935 [Fulvivirga sp.]|uniref:hypothetical protein n=1 Tax=Fulvivirga sp. TaxID=1931237 RepID=UPI0032EAD542